MASKLAVGGLTLVCLVGGACGGAQSDDFAQELDGQIEGGSAQSDAGAPGSDGGEPIDAGMDAAPDEGDFDAGMDASPPDSGDGLDAGDALDASSDAQSVTEGGTDAGDAGGTDAGDAGGTDAGDAGDAGPELFCTGAGFTGSHLEIVRDELNPDKIDSLRWLDSSGVFTANLSKQGGNNASICGEPSEYFGQALAFSEGTEPNPVPQSARGTIVSDEVCDQHNVVTLNTNDCLNNAQLPVTTDYHLFDGEHASMMKVTRTIGFDENTPLYSGAGFIAYTTRIPHAEFGTVIYPNQAGNGITSANVLTCPGGCGVAFGPTFSGKWFADVSATTGRAMIVVRDASSTAPAQLVINYDSFSASNLTGFMMIEPVEGFSAPVVETQYVCFADLVSWPQAQRTAAVLPAGCQPPSTDI